MTEERYIAQTLPAEVVREDRDLEQSREAASEALAHLRWHWTLNESNPDAVSLRSYAKSVGRHTDTILVYARGYVLLTHSVGEHSISECIERARHSADKQTIIEAVAEANDMTFINARQRHKDEVREVKHAVRNEEERRAEDNESFTPEDKEEYAHKVAKMKADSRKAEERHREEQRRNHSLKFMEMDALASKVRQASRELLDVTRDVDLGVFSEEEVRLLERQIVAAHEMVGLTRTALSGDSGTDWDKALADLEEKRQYG